MRRCFRLLGLGAALTLCTAPLAFAQQMTPRDQAGTIAELDRSGMTFVLRSDDVHAQYSYSSETEVLSPHHEKLSLESLRDGLAVVVHATAAPREPRVASRVEIVGEDATEGVREAN